MVSIVWALIALSSGLLAYLLTSILAPVMPIPLQQSIARYHSGLAMRAYRQAALVRRQLGTYELYPLSTNDEEKLARVTLDSGVVGDDEELEFGDPDNRLLRLHKKPFALVYERIPASIDAELAEIGHWTRQRDDEVGLYDEATEKIDPYVPVKAGLRVVDPAAIADIVPKDVQPENIKTARMLTKERFSKYGSNVGVAETLGVITGFAVGAGGVAAMQYIERQLLAGSGGGGGGPAGPPIGIPTMLGPDTASMVVDVAVVVA